MNTYKISFSLFDKINPKTHFSNCKAIIEGDSFEDAVEKFKHRKLEEGWLVGFLCEGDMFNVEFFDLNTNEIVKLEKKL